MLEKLPNKSFSNFRFSVTKYVLFQAFQENLTAWTRQFILFYKIRSLSGISGEPDCLDETIHDFFYLYLLVYFVFYFTIKSFFYLFVLIYFVFYFTIKSPILAVKRPNTTQSNN